MCDQTVAWLVAHKEVVIPLMVVLLSSLATGLSRYPKVGGWTYWLRWAAGLLSSVTHADAPGTFKFPGLPPPVPPPKLTEVIVAASSAPSVSDPVPPSEAP